MLTDPPQFREGVHEAELAWFVENAPKWAWHWAKTFADGAHHMYVMKGKHLDARTYERAVRVVMALGEPANFYRRVNLELHLPKIEIPYGAPGREEVLRGFKFWPMTNEMSISQAFNMAPMHLAYGEQTAARSRGEDTAPSQFDFMACELDWYLERAGTLKTWKRPLQRALGIDQGAYPNSVLELGPTTGFAKDLDLLPPAAAYRIVDGSQGMLNQAIFKHNVSEVRPMDPNDYLDPRYWEDETFNTVLAMFGAASYLDAKAVEEAYVRTRSNLILMHYSPDTGSKRDFGLTLPEGHRESARTARNLPGARTTRAGGYDVTVVRK